MNFTVPLNVTAAFVCSQGLTTTLSVPAGFQGCASVLEGEATFGANRRTARPAQLVLLGPGGEFAVTDAAPGTRIQKVHGLSSRNGPPTRANEQLQR
jgi:hypothetical protein